MDDPSENFGSRHTHSKWWKFQLVEVPTIVLLLLHFCFRSLSALIASNQNSRHAQQVVGGQF